MVIFLNVMETFGEWLKSQIKSAGITQQELADRIGLKPAQISRIVSGTRGTSIESLASIATALHIQPEKAFRVACGLPPIPELNEIIEEIIFDLRQLPDREKEDIRDTVKAKVKRHERERDEGTAWKTKRMG